MVDPPVAYRSGRLTSCSDALIVPVHMQDVYRVVCTPNLVNGYPTTRTQSRCCFPGTATRQRARNSRLRSVQANGRVMSVGSNPLSGRILDTPEVSRDGIVVAAGSRDGQKPVLASPGPWETGIYGSIAG
jgi:hypothetical protein